MVPEPAGEAPTGAPPQPAEPAFGSIPVQVPSGLQHPSSPHQGVFATSMPPRAAPWSQPLAAAGAGSALAPAAVPPGLFNSDPTPPPNCATVAAVLQSLTAQGMVTAQHAQAYLSLWQLLDPTRQAAAQQLLVCSISLLQSPTSAVEHIMTVICQNRR